MEGKHVSDCSMLFLGYQKHICKRRLCITRLVTWIALASGNAHGGEEFRLKELKGAKILAASKGCLLLPCSSSSTSSDALISSFFLQQSGCGRDGQRFCQLMKNQGAWQAGMQKLCPKWSPLLCSLLCCQQQVAHLRVGLVQGKLLGRHSALPAFSNSAALVPSRCRDGEDLSVGAREKQVVRRL